MKTKKMKIPEHIKKFARGELKDYVTTVRMTKSEKDFIDRNNISPTALFSWAISILIEDN